MEFRAQYPEARLGVFADVNLGILGIEVPRPRSRPVVILVH